MPATMPVSPAKKAGPKKVASKAKKPAAKKAAKPKWDKNDPRGPRPSPTSKAVDETVGHEEEGNDGLWYIVAEDKNNRNFWKKMKE